MVIGNVGIGNELVLPSRFGRPEKPERYIVDSPVDLPPLKQDEDKPREAFTTRKYFKVVTKENDSK
jgi:hypothetical protein